MTERSIPHLRDIFGDKLEGYGSNNQIPRDDGQSEPLANATNKKKKGKGRPDPDLRHIERHLSMKKTIRKKMMRDLQQTSLESPEDIQNLSLECLDLSGKKRGKEEEGSFLDFLKMGGGKSLKIGEGELSGGGANKEGAQTDDEQRKAGFWRRFTIKRNKR